MKKKFTLLIILAFFIGVVSTASISYYIYSNKLSIGKDIGNYKKLAFDYVYGSGESEALQYEAYNSATKSLNEMVKKPSNKPKAVVLDIDQTSLNNAPFQGYEILNANGGFDYNTWIKWVDYAKATAIPGSIAFTQAAKKDGVQVFYVSGRNPSELNATEKNLTKLGFADANEPGHIILYPPSQGGKEPTFDKLEQNYDVLMYIGDQLSDMSSKFYGSPSIQRAQVTNDKSDFGTKYIILPNPLYGNFLGSLEGSNNLTDKEQAEKINENIQTFNPNTGKVYYNT